MPAVISGVVLMLWLTRTTLNIQSGIGAIMAARRGGRECDPARDLCGARADWRERRPMSPPRRAPGAGFAPSS